MMVVSREQMTTDKSFVMHTGCAQFSIYSNIINGIVIIIIIIKITAVLPRYCTVTVAQLFYCDTHKVLAMAAATKAAVQITD